MKIKSLIVGFSAALLTALSAQAQGVFLNLNFEQANPVKVIGSPDYPYVVTATSALPDWTVTEGGVQQTQIYENDPSTGSPSVELISAADNFGFVPIDGNYSVLLQGSYPGSASISQTGVIPAGTQSLLFEAQTSGAALAVLIGTQSVPFTAIGTGPNYTLYGANVSEWANDTEQLTFSALEPTSAGLNNWVIDDISFSPVPSPEPSIGVLTAIGGLLFGARKWFARP